MTHEEHKEKAIAHAIFAFRNHKAKYKVLDGIDTLEFRNPDSICYSLRMVFDHERGRSVYICGDIGEAVIYPTCPATLKGMAECFTLREENGTIHVRWEYFLEKVRAKSDRYEWSQKLFKEDFGEMCDARDIEMPEDFFEEYMDGWGNEIEVDDRIGVRLTERAMDALKEMDEDYREWVYDCGKRVSKRVIMWMVAMRLAYEALEGATGNEGGAE